MDSSSSPPPLPVLQATKRQRLANFNVDYVPRATSLDFRQIEGQQISGRMFNPKFYLFRYEDKSNNKVWFVKHNEIRLLNEKAANKRYCLIGMRSRYDGPLKYEVAYVDHDFSLRTKWIDSPTFPGYMPLIGRDVMKEVDGYDPISTELLKVLFYLAVKYDDHPFTAQMVAYVQRNLNPIISLRGRTVADYQTKIATAEKQIAALQKDIEVYKTRIEQEEEKEALVSLTAKIAYQLDTHPEEPAVMEVAKQQLSSENL